MRHNILTDSLVFWRRCLNCYRPNSGCTNAFHTLGFRSRILMNKLCLSQIGRAEKFSNNSANVAVVIFRVLSLRVSETLT
jgi:hypothetical protein